MVGRTRFSLISSVLLVTSAQATLITSAIFAFPKNLATPTVGSTPDSPDKKRATLAASCWATEMAVLELRATHFMVCPRTGKMRPMKSRPAELNRPGSNVIWEAPITLLPMGTSNGSNPNKSAAPTRGFEIFSDGAARISQNRNEMTRAFLWFGFLSGLIFCAVCTFYARLDWGELQRAYAAFSSLKSDDLIAVFRAEARQNIHRINVFADVVWALLSAILATLCATSLAVLRRLDDKK